MSATSEGLEQSITIHLHIFIYIYTYTYWHTCRHIDRYRHRHRHKHRYRVDSRLLSNVLHDLHLLPKRSLWIQQLGFLSRSFLGDRLSIPPADPTRSSSSEIARLELDLSMLLLGPAYSMLQMLYSSTYRLDTSTLVCCRLSCLTPRLQ